MRRPGYRGRRQIDFSSGRGFDSRFDRPLGVWNIEAGLFCTGHRSCFRNRPRSETRLRDPSADLPTNLVRQLSESQAADLSCLINPCQLADRSYPGRRIHRKAEMDRAIRLHRRDSAKAHASLRDVHDNPAVIGRQAKVSEILRYFSRAVSAFVRHHQVVAPDFLNDGNMQIAPEIAQPWRFCANKTPCKSKAVLTVEQA